MYKLDLYIIKKFLGTFVFMIMAFLVIAVVFDLSEKIDDFIKHDVSFRRIFTQYYFNFVLYLGNLLSPVLVFLTVILVTSSMAQKSELIAILSGGISYFRILRPYFIAASILTLFTLGIAHYLLPNANKERLAFEEGIVSNKFNISEENLHREVAPGEIAYFQSITASKSVGYKFSLEFWDNEGRLRSKLIAAKARYYPEELKWELTNVQIRKIDHLGNESIQTIERMDTVMNFKITDFGQRVEAAMTLGNRELDAFINEQKASGSDKVTYFLIEKYSRTSNAFAIIVLTLIGVSVSSRKTRGGTGLHIALGVLIGFVYIFAMKMAAVSATNAGVSPMLAVWLPNILFSIIAVFLYFRAPK